MKIMKPKFWDQNYFTFLSILFLPLTFLYIVVIKLRKVFSNPKKFPISIICIGNIYIGGTGKTPVSLKVCKILRDLKQSPVVIKKKYNNQYDEVSLIKKYNKILVSEKREEAINNAIEKNFNFAVLDDGYQDLNIKKDLNIICFHGSQRIGNGFIVPSGPLRESLLELNNAHIVLINGKKDLQFENKLKKYNPKLDFFYYNYVTKNIENFKNKKLIAFAGIGNPENFFNLLKDNHLNVVKEVSYPDHFNYNENELEKLEKLEIQYKAKLITTEKDFLRIDQFKRKKYDYIKVEIKFDEEELFKNKIKKMIK